MLIGTFSKQTGLSIRALHFYDQEGLLKPAIKAEHNKYRYYSFSQIDIAKQIRTYRETNVPLEVIKRILENPLQTKSLLSAHLELLRQKLVTDQTMLIQLEQMVQNL